MLTKPAPACVSTFFQDFLLEGRSVLIWLNGCLRVSNVENFERTDQFGNTVGRVTINVISHRLICKLERLRANKISIAVSTCGPEYSAWWISWLKQTVESFIEHFSNEFVVFGSCVGPMKSLRVLLNGLVSGSYFRFAGQSLFRLKCSRIGPLCGAAVGLCCSLFGVPKWPPVGNKWHLFVREATLLSSAVVDSEIVIFKDPIFLVQIDEWLKRNPSERPVCPQVPTVTFQFYNVSSTCDKFSLL